VRFGQHGDVTAAIDVRPAAERFRTEAALRSTAHSFSFGAHYDPHNVGFGALVAHNDELLQPSGGYPDHPHVDTEIVTWVLAGALRHRDDQGNDRVVRSGQLQRLSAGSGVVHSEVGEGPGPTRFVQAWVRPDERGLAPSYVCAAVTPAAGAWTCLAGDGGVPLGARDVALHLGLPRPGRHLTVPGAPRVHLFVDVDNAASQAVAIRAGFALSDEEREDYAARAAVLLEPYREDAIARVVAEEVLPGLGVEP